MVRCVRPALSAFISTFESVREQRKCDPLKFIMIVLTAQMYYNVFAVLWSTMSILISGPVYFQIDKYAGSGSLCYYPNPTLIYAKEDNTTGIWQNMTECLFCSFTQYEEISSHESEQIQDEMQLFCAVNVTLYGSITLGKTLGEYSIDEEAKNLQPYSYKHNYPLAVLTITAFQHIAQNPTPMLDLSISGGSAFALLVSSFGVLDFSNELGNFQNFDLSSRGREIAIRTPLLSAIFDYKDDIIYASSNVSEVMNEDTNCSIIAIQGNREKVESLATKQIMKEEYANCSLTDNNAVKGQREPMTNEQLTKEDVDLNSSQIVDNVVQGKGEKVESLTNFGLSVGSWICVAYILFMGVVNVISCFLNKKMRRQVENEIATCQVIQQKLEKANLKVRAQAKTCIETLECQEKAKKQLNKVRRAAIVDRDGLLCNYNTLQVIVKRRAFLAESKHCKRSFKYLRGKMKKSTLQLNRMYERRKRTLLDEEKCLRKKNRYFKFHLEIARNVTMQIVEQLKNGRDLIQDTLLAKKTEKEEGMKILRQTLEAEIQEADENAAKLSDETRNVDDKIKAVNTKTKFIELALEDLERQMQLNILSMHNEIDECKAKLAQTAEPIKPPSNAKSTSVMASLRKRFNHITCRSTISYKVDDKVNNDANGNSEGLPDSCTSRLEDKKNI